MSLTNSQYDEVMRAYQQKQIARQHLIAERQEELAKVCPELADIDAAIAHTGVSGARRMLNGESNVMESIRSEIAELSEQKKEILSHMGYPYDYLDPPYECSDCKDTGYIGNQKCHCLRQAAINLVYTQSNLKDILKEENFSTYQLAFYSDDLYEQDSDLSSRAAARNAYTKCVQFVQNFDRNFENIFLFGSTGVGKTFLSNCIAKELLDTGHSVIYFSAHRFFDILAKNTFGKDRTYADDYRNIFDCDLLIIDDLGTEMANAFTTSQFFVCLNERIQNKKSTLISSNLELSDIANIYSERVFSRISNSYILLHLFGQDIRIQKKLAEM